jgi:hypothetical protein
LTLLTALTVLTADIVDEVDLIGFRRQQRQRRQFCPLSMPSFLSMPSIPSNMRPPLGGVERAAHEVTLALIPSDDFGEIIDNRPPMADARSSLKQTSR